MQTTSSVYKRVKIILHVNLNKSNKSIKYERTNSFNENKINGVGGLIFVFNAMHIKNYHREAHQT